MNIRLLTILFLIGISVMIPHVLAASNDRPDAYVKWLDDSYLSTDTGVVRIVDHYMNMDSEKVESLVVDIYSEPNVAAYYESDIESIKITITETNVDTGIFEGTMFFSETRESSGHRLHVSDGDFISVEYTYFTVPGSDALEDMMTIGHEITINSPPNVEQEIVDTMATVQWLETSYPSDDVGHVRIIDPDMNLNPEKIDYFDVDVWSDSDAAGIDLTVTETNEATGIFEGTVFFSTTDNSSGHRLRVAEGDTITAEYEDNTLPDPYTSSDQLDIIAISLIDIVIDETDDDIPIETNQETSVIAPVGQDYDVYYVMIFIAGITTVIIVVLIKKFRE